MVGVMVGRRVVGSINDRSIAFSDELDTLNFDLSIPGESHEEEMVSSNQLYER